MTHKQIKQTKAEAKAAAEKLLRAIEHTERMSTMLHKQGRKCWVDRFMEGKVNYVVEA